MMEVIAKIVSAAMVSVFVQNAIFDRAFGSNVGIYASRKNSTVIGFTLGITAMTTLASIVSFFVDQAMLPTAGSSPLRNTALSADLAPQLLTLLPRNALFRSSRSA